MKYCKGSIKDIYQITIMWRDEQKEVWKDEFKESDTDFDRIGLELNNPSNLFIIAKEGKKFVGFGFFKKVTTLSGGFYISIEDIFVNKKYRIAHGAAEYFIESALKDFPEDTIVRCMTRPDGPEQKRIEKLGFTKRMILWENKSKSVIEKSKTGGK